jgi:pyruvate dehydrogenase E2 component (dihydrolipoamide acetyltransferase)
MAVEVVMPKFGLTMQQGTIQQWFRAEGESVTAGDPLFEVETEKVLYEVEAPSDGVVAAILYPVESVVPVGSVVAVIAVAGEDPVAVASRYEKTAAQVVPSIPAAPAAQSEVVREERRTAAATPTESGPPGDRVTATPAARKLAKERGIDLASVKGTGPGGRVTREDVENVLSAAPAAPEVVPWQGMRKRIAARMFQSLQTTAQLTITTEVDVTEMVHRRVRLQKGQPITYNDLLVHAVGRALREHPRLNATVEGQAARVHLDVNVGVAVALDEGLIVPVIRNADRKSPAEIAQESRELGEKARAGTLSVDDVSGGTFTVSNLGMYGVDAFTPIIDLPQVAILGVGRVRQKPVVHEGEIAIRHTLILSLTFDHRAVDGVPAAAFLQSVVKYVTTSQE